MQIKFFRTATVILISLGIWAGHVNGPALGMIHDGEDTYILMKVSKPKPTYIPPTIRFPTDEERLAEIRAREEWVQAHGSKVRAAACCVCGVVLSSCCWLTLGFFFAVGGINVWPWDLNP